MFEWAELLILIGILFWGAILAVLWTRVLWATWCDCIRPWLDIRRGLAHLRRLRGVRR